MALNVKFYDPTKDKYEIIPVVSPTPNINSLSQNIDEDDGEDNGVAWNPSQSVVAADNVSDSEAGKYIADNKKPVESDYTSGAEWFKSFASPPISPEEEERRKKAALAVEGIGHLGNIFSSISNLIYTGKGAPSQTMPQAPSSNIASFEDRIRRMRDNYNSARLQAINFDRNSFQQALKNYNVGLSAAYKVDNDRLEAQRKAAKDAVDWAYKQGELEHKKKALGVKAALDSAKIEETKRNNNVRNEIAKQRADTYGKYVEKAGGKGKKDYGKIRFVRTTGSGESKDYDLNKDTDVMDAYKEAVKLGHILGATPNNINEARSKLLYIRGDKKEVPEGHEPEWFNGLGWGESAKGNNSKTDW